MITKGGDDKGIVDQSFYNYIVEQLKQVLNAEGCYQTQVQNSTYDLVDENDALKGSIVVPVVTGFFGPVPGSILKAIGRGYTDLTAALIAVAVEAKELQIWKEVDGIFTADPRKIPSARLLASISPEEAAELTYYGSEVIHPFTMEQVIRASIPIRIKNTFNPNGFGTVILPKGFRESDHEVCFRIDPLSSSTTLSQLNLNSDSFLKGQSFKHPTAVTIKDNVTILNVHSNRKRVSHGFFAHIFQTLDK